MCTLSGTFPFCSSRVCAIRVAVHSADCFYHPLHHHCHHQLHHQTTGRSHWQRHHGGRNECQTAAWHRRFLWHGAMHVGTMSGRLLIKITSRFWPPKSFLVNITGQRSRNFKTCCLEINPSDGTVTLTTFEAELSLALNTNDLAANAVLSDNASALILKLNSNVNCLTNSWPFTCASSDLRNFHRHLDG